MSVNKIDKITGDTTKIAGGTLYADNPIGSIISYGGATAPSGWLICDGTAISRITYSELFAVIGTNFGGGDGSSTFNLPDLRGEFLRGAGTNSHSGQGNGGSVGEHQDATVQNDAYCNDQGALVHPLNSTSNYDTRTTDNNRGYIAKNNSDSYGVKYTARPTNTSVNYIIKVKMVAVPADFMSKVEEANEYSVTETVVGKWIDGKPIYRKVLNISTSAFTAGNNWVNISIPNLETVVDMKGVTKHNTASSNYVLPVSPQDNTSRLMLDTISSSSLLVLVGSWWIENKIHYSELNVILEYTKTTE